MIRGVGGPKGFGELKFSFADMQPTFISVLQHYSHLGHFLFTCNLVAETSLNIGAEFQPTYDQELREELDLVLAHRETVEETRYHARKPHICARCLRMKLEDTPSVRGLLREFPEATILR